MSNITRELAVPPRPAGPLNVARFMPSEAELAFLKKVISEVAQSGMLDGKRATTNKAGFKQVQVSNTLFLSSHEDTKISK